MAVSEEIKKQYTPTIGIECHVQLKTKTKLFAAVGNDAREAPPNSLISHICVGMPGALPVLNEAALELAAKAAFALGTKPQKFSHFDRKHYFYPDLPKGYQITQYAKPIIADGHVHFSVNGETRCVEIIRAHLEEDAGKNTHPAGADYSLVDLNRAGTPLLEIVSAPGLHSPAEAKAFARELYLLMKYAGVSDVDLYHGNMRFDVNTSVSKTNKLGTRSEVKNLNSFRSVENAVAYEIERQIELLENGEKVIQETRGWNEAKQKTDSQRGKEEAEDYRYFPEPDVPPVELSEDFIGRIERELPNLPEVWRKQLSHLDMNRAEIETLLDFQAEENAPDLLSIIAETSNDSEYGKFVANLIINTVIPFCRYLEQQKVQISGFDREKLFAGVYRLFREGKISSNGVKELTQKFLNPATKNLSADIEKQAQTEGLLQVSDEGEIEAIVKKILAENAKAAEDVKDGEIKAIGFLVGQVMKESQGKANPGLAQEIIKKQLGI